MRRNPQPDARTLATISDNALLTAAQAAEYLDVHRDTLRRWVVEGRIRDVRVGGASAGRVYFRAEDIKASLVAPAPRPAGDQRLLP